MTEIELAYIAGFVDGEGFIGYIKGKDKSHKKLQYRLCIKISNIDYAILTWIQKTLKTGTITKLSTRFGCKSCYQWSCYCSKAKNIIELLKPYLRIKAGQGRLL